MIRLDPFVLGMADVSAAPESFSGVRLTAGRFDSSPAHQLKVVDPERAEIPEAAEAVISLSGATAVHLTDTLPTSAAAALLVRSHCSGRARARESKPARPQRAGRSAIRRLRDYRMHSTSSETAEH